MIFVVDQIFNVYTHIHILYKISMLITVSITDRPLLSSTGNLLRSGDIRGYQSMARMYTRLAAMPKKGWSIWSGFCICFFILLDRHVCGLLLVVLKTNIENYLWVCWVKILILSIHLFCCNNEDKEPFQTISIKGATLTVYLINGIIENPWCYATNLYWKSVLHINL